MNDERFLELDRSGQGLTEEEWKQGYHWCAEWDDMLVGPGQDEALFCYCEHPAIEEWKQSEEGKRMQREMDERMESYSNPSYSNPEPKVVKKLNGIVGEPRKGEPPHTHFEGLFD